MNDHESILTTKIYYVLLTLQVTSWGVLFLEVGVCLVLAVSATMVWVCLERLVPSTELGKSTIIT